MPSPSQKVQIDIYRIDIQSIFNEMANNTLDEEKIEEYQVLIQRIMQRDNALTLNDVHNFLSLAVDFVIGEQNGNLVTHPLQYDIVNLQNVDNLPYKLFLFAASTRPLNAMAVLLSGKINADTINSLRNTNTSCVLFAYNQNEMYAFCSGSGWHVVQRYIDQFFGIQVLSRLIPQDSPAISAMKNRAFSGSIAGQSTTYRRSVRPIEVVDFGQVCKDLAGSIQTSILRDRLNLAINTKRTHINGDFKNSFRLRRKMNLQEIVQLLDRLTALLDTAPYFSFEEWLGITPLSETKSDRRRKDRLKTALSNILYDYVNSPAPRQHLGYFVSNEKIEDYSCANRFDLVIKNPINFSRSVENLFEIDDLAVILQEILEGIGDDDEAAKRHEFATRLNDAQIYAYEQHGQDTPTLLTKGKLFEHVHGEVWDDAENQAFILLDGAWYTVYDGLKQRLNQILPTLLRNRLVQNHPLPAWVDGDEEAYIQHVIATQGGAALHRKRPLDNIELCDLIRIEGNAVCLYHIKDSFDTTMRTLVSQIRDSAALIADIRSNGRTVELEAKWRELNNEVPNLLPWADFLSAITGTGDKQLVERLVIRPTCDILSHPEMSRSTIAKYELAALVKLWSYGINFEVVIL